MDQCLYLSLYYCFSLCYILATRPNKRNSTGQDSLTQAGQVQEGGEDLHQTRFNLIEYILLNTVPRYEKLVFKMPRIWLRKYRMKQSPIYYFSLSVVFDRQCLKPIYWLSSASIVLTFNHCPLKLLIQDQAITMIGLHTFMLIEGHLIGLTSVSLWRHAQAAAC